MVYFMLYINAELENLTNLQPAGGVNDPNFTYFFELKCENCMSESERDCLFTKKQDCQSSAKGGSWDLGDVQFSVQTLQKGRNHHYVICFPLTLHHSETGMFAPLMLFDCKSFVPQEFAFSTGWKAESIAGVTFEDINLDGGEFCDYDAKRQMWCNGM